MRKQYCATFKAAPWGHPVKALRKEEKTINQLAADLGVHPSQWKEWKQLTRQGLPELFNRASKAGEQAKAHEQQVTDLYSESAPGGNRKKIWS